MSDRAEHSRPQLPPDLWQGRPLGWLTWHHLAAGLVILLFGWIRLPVETRLTRESHAASFGKTQLNLALRDKIGQMGFLAALSGFRTLVADGLWIQAHIEWERTQYGRMNLLLGTVTTLAPRNVIFWDQSGWHMAYNASVAAFNDQKQPNLAKRLKAQREYFTIGKDYIERGIVNNPESYTLYQSLAFIYKDKFKDHRAASEAFDKAAACPKAPVFMKRFAATELSFCPGHEREAWVRLRAIHDLGEQERLPTLETQLKLMEEKLGLPAEQRVYKNS